MKNSVWFEPIEPISKGDLMAKLNIYIEIYKNKRKKETLSDRTCREMKMLIITLCGKWNRITIEENFIRLKRKFHLIKTENEPHQTM